MFFKKKDNKEEITAEIERVRLRTGLERYQLPNNRNFFRNWFQKRNKFMKKTSFKELLKKYSVFFSTVTECSGDKEFNTPKLSRL